jgi:DNA-binding transcriptional LysR family regulator
MRQISDIDLRLLHVFTAVVEAGGFAPAETSLNIGTSTISIHMSDLEKRLGFRLCDRGRSGFRLTDRGRLVYEECKRIFATLDDFSGTLAGMRETLAGRLVIGSVDGVVTHPSFPVTGAIRRFNETDNSVEFELVTDSRQELERAVLDGRIHAAIGPFVRNISGLHFHPLFEEHHLVYCGRGHPLFGLSAQDLEQRPLLQHRSDPAHLPSGLRPQPVRHRQGPGRSYQHGSDAHTAAQRPVSRLSADSLCPRLGGARRTMATRPATNGVQVTAHADYPRSGRDTTLLDLFTALLIYETTAASEQA